MRRRAGTEGSLPSKTYRCRDCRAGQVFTEEDVPSTAVNRSSAARSKVGGSDTGPFPLSTVIRATLGRFGGNHTGSPL